MDLKTGVTESIKYESELEIIWKDNRYYRPLKLQCGNYYYKN